MKAIQTGKVVAAIAIAAALGACSSWQRTDKETGTATGAVGGAVAGAVVAGPPGAVVGGVGGAIVGHETTGKDQVTTTRSTTTMQIGVDERVRFRDDPARSAGAER